MMNCRRLAYIQKWEKKLPGNRIVIIENGRFVLKGCEELNKPLDD